MGKQTHVRIKGMKGLRNNILGALHASYFSQDVHLYYKNTKSEAIRSAVMPFLALLYVSYESCRYGFFGHKSCDNLELFVWIVIALIIAIPKFILSFIFVWHLCKLLKQTEFFYAFIAANNWLYLIYIPLYSIFSLVFKSNLDPAIILIVTQFYIFLVVMSLGQCVLKLQPEGVWLLPMAFFFSFLIIKIATTKHGIFFVF